MAFADGPWRALANGMLFNLSWLGVVYIHLTPVALLVVAIHLAVHWRFFSRWSAEWWFILAVSLVGIMLDRVVLQLGLLQVPAGQGGNVVWLHCLWPVLATTFMHAFGSLQGRPLLAAVFGFVGGYGSYSLGVRISPLEFGQEHSALIIAVLWAVLFPVLLEAARWATRPVTARQAC